MICSIHSLPCALLHSARASFSKMTQNLLRAGVVSTLAAPLGYIFFCSWMAHWERVESRERH